MSSASWDELRKQAARKAEETAERARLREAELDAELAAGRDQRSKEVELTLDGMLRDCSDAFLQACEFGGLSGKKETFLRIEIPVFGGLFFDSNEPGHHSVLVYGAGWVEVDTSVTLEDAAESWIEHATPPTPEFSDWMGFAMGLAKTLESVNRKLDQQMDGK